MSTTIAKRIGLAAGWIGLLLLASVAQAQLAGAGKLPVPIVDVNVAAGTVTAGSNTYRVTGSTQLSDPDGLAITLGELKTIATDKLNVPNPSPNDLRWAMVKTQSGSGQYDDLVELALKPAQGE